MTEIIALSWKRNLFYFFAYCFSLKTFEANGFDTTDFLTNFVVIINVFLTVDFLS